MLLTPTTSTALMAGRSLTMTFKTPFSSASCMFSKNQWRKAP